MNELPDDKVLTVGDMKAMFRDQSRLFKNGEPWGDYFRDKWLTPKNLGWLVALCLYGYGEWRDVKSDAKEAKASTILITADNTKLTERVNDMAKTVNTVQATIDTNREHTRVEIAALKADVQSQMRMTRKDFTDQIDTLRTPLRDIQNTVKDR